MHWGSARAEAEDDLPCTFQMIVVIDIPCTFQMIVVSDFSSAIAILPQHHQAFALYKKTTFISVACFMSFNNGLKDNTPPNPVHFKKNTYVEWIIRIFCETQPPASIGWVALSSVVRLFVPHSDISSYLHCMMFQTIQTIYFLWGYDPGNMSVSFIAELSPVYCCLVTTVHGRGKISFNDHCQV